jgi:hypothetical protein
MVSEIRDIELRLLTNSNIKIKMNFRDTRCERKRSARSTSRFGESERQDLTPFLVFTDLLDYESEALCQFINLGIQSLDDSCRDLNNFQDMRY